MKKILSLALALMMLMGMLPLTAMAESTEPYWEIQIYSELANYAGVQTGWFAKLLKDKFNVGVNVISASEGGSDRWATQMISRDLGDLVMLGDNNGQQHLSEAVEAGLLLDISGMMEQYAPNILKNYPLLLEKAKIQFGNGTAVYAIGSEAVPTTSDLQIEGGTDSWWGPYGRWDLYAKLGYPEIKTIEDLVPVLKAMHDLEPVNADGEPTYAMSLFKDWDGGTMMAATQFYAIFGYGDQWNYVFPHATEDSYITLLDEDGIYFRTLKFYFDLNQLGLLDPDSITQTYGEVTTKEQTGRVLFNWFNPIKANFNTAERLAEGKAMTLLPMSTQCNYGYTGKPYGYGRTVSIGANCEQPERLLKIIDWIFSDEGLMEVNNGPKGVTWDYDENGVPTLTELGWACYNDQMTEIPAEFGGGTFYEGMNKGFYVYPSLNNNLANGYPANRDLWPCVLSREMPEVLKDWSEHHGGALTSIQALINKGNIVKTINQAVFSTEPALQMNAILQQKSSQVGSILTEYNWKMVLAADEAEFNALKTEMVEKAKGLGYDEIVAFGIQECERMFRARKIMNEELSK
ncbi:MAG: extracellular solute-binding protein [Clostridia bacterium]|nr:extracellular solute-binding protein [Clostridia bacterium]